MSFEYVLRLYLIKMKLCLQKFEKWGTEKKVEITF